MHRQEFVVCCVFCGEVIALKMGGERVPEAIHLCAEDTNPPAVEAEGLDGDAISPNQLKGA